MGNEETFLVTYETDGSKTYTITENVVDWFMQHNKEHIAPCYILNVLPITFSEAMFLEANGLGGT